MIWLILFVVLLLIAVVVLKPDLEKEELNDETRAKLGGSFVELSDGVTHYELNGTAKKGTVVLVHGNAAWLVSWDHNVEALLAAGFRVLRYDIYGHGYSDRPRRRRYTRAMFDRQLSELLEALQIEGPLYLVGTSQGGSICAYFVQNHPGRAAKVALLAPLFDSFNGAGAAVLLKAIGVGEFLMRVFGDKMLCDPGKGLATDARRRELAEKLALQVRFKGKKRAVLANMRGDSFEQAEAVYAGLREAAIPVLLTWGRRDQSIPRDSMTRLREFVANVEYHELDEAAHLAHYEFPEQINRLLTSFLLADGS